jgi:hypothetical protein
MRVVLGHKNVTSNCRMRSAYLGGVEALRSAVMSEREPVGVRGAAGGAAGGEGGVAGVAAARGGELAGSRLARSTILQNGDILASAYSYIPNQVESTWHLNDEFSLKMREKQADPDPTFQLVSDPAPDLFRIRHNFFLIYLPLYS